MGDDAILTITWTSIQKQRLIELNADKEILEMTFREKKDRDSSFQKIEKSLVDEARAQLENFKRNKKRPAICELESKLVEALLKEGFVQVVTPTILSKGLLEKMTISKDHPLFQQVFWIDSKRCLRPMLAPNLYYLWRNLVRIWEKPIRIFEIGSCFRKESQGSHHLNEFTMLNLTELGLPEDKRHDRLKELANLVMKTVGITNYELRTTTSAVYGDTIDIEAGIELGSGAMGPHPLDVNWGIVDTWVGIGFGLERMLMVREGGKNIQRMARSLSYIDGIRLNI